MRMGTGTRRRRKKRIVDFKLNTGYSRLTARNRRRMIVTTQSAPASVVVTLEDIPKEELPKRALQSRALFGEEIIQISVWTSSGVWEDKQGNDLWVNELPYLGMRAGWMKTEYDGEVFYCRPESDKVSLSILIASFE